MRSNICHISLHIAFFILSLFSFRLKITTATRLGSQLVPKGGVGNCKCIDKERHALLDFKAYIQKDPYNLLSTWTSKENATNDCCKWAGLTCNNQTGHVTSLDLFNGDLEGEISHSLLNLTYLNHLDLSHNSFNGTIPMFIGSMTQLRFLDIGWNDFTGAIPPELGNLTNLQVLSIRFLSSCRVESLDWLSHLSQLEGLGLYGNSLAKAKADNWVNMILSFRKLSILNLDSCDLSQIMHPYSYSSVNSSSSCIVVLYLGNNNLNASMYHWLFPLTSNRLVFLDLSRNKLEGIPKYLGNLCSLTHLFIYNNSMVVTFPKFLDNLSGCTSLRLEYLGAQSCQLTGSLPDDIKKFSSLVWLKLSKNKLSGGISFLCQFCYGSLTFLDLSNNYLTGQIPNCLWQFRKLQTLNLGYNNLSGELPASFESLISLKVLYLNNNNFSGEFPLSLKNCTHLDFLYLGANEFSGNVPLWIGEKLPRLYALSLTSNKFFGTIPLKLCQLVNLQMLDLSMNRLFGTIPSCFNNLSAMVHDGLSSYQNVRYYYWRIQGATNEHKYVDHAMIKWQGSVREFSSTLGLVKSIDLSRNNLTGKIPYELTELHELISLDLSNNVLSGEIPWEIGEMKNLLTLNISKNSLCGGMPSSMSQMTSLNYLDVSYNNLSGRIPSGTQLQSFEPSRYTGNAGLCGIPLTKYCPGDKELDASIVVGQSKGGGEDIDELERWFFIGGATGFATGFWIASWALLVNHHGRNICFHFFNSLKY